MHPKEIAEKLSEQFGIKIDCDLSEMNVITLYWRAAKPIHDNKYPAILIMTFHRKQHTIKEEWACSTYDIGIPVFAFMRNDLGIEFIDN